MLKEDQPVDVLAIRRNGSWTLKIFTPDSQKAKEVIITRHWLDGCKLIENWIDKQEEENGKH